MIDGYIRIRHTNPNVEIPAGSLAKLDGWDPDNKCFKVIQPDRDNLPFCQIVIIPFTIPAGSIARIGIAYIDDFHILLKATEDSIVAGDKVGTTKNSWLAKENGRGMFVVEAVDGNNLYVRPTIRDFVLCSYID